jgi:hypothetical protein
MLSKRVLRFMAGFLLSIPLVVAAEAAAVPSASAVTPAPYAVAVTSCFETYSTAFGPNYTVDVDVDVYNMPSSAWTYDNPGQQTPTVHTLAYVVPQGYNYTDTSPVGISEGQDGAGATSPYAPGSSGTLNVTVKYTASNGSTAFLPTMQVTAVPQSQCANANSTNVSSPPGGVTAPIVGMASTPDGNGYWMVGADGRVYAYGDASLFTLAGGNGSEFIQPNKPIVGMAVTPDGRGYWLVAADGGIFSYGDAVFHGSTGAITLNKPIVGMAATQDGGGYWLVASDGGIFAFGDAVYQGSMGGTPLNKPVVGMAADFATGGYWLVASDGGIFSFNAPFMGSTGSIVLNKPIVGMEAAADGSGYRFVATDGGVFCFGQPFAGSTGNLKLNQPIAAMAPSGSDGYWLGAQDGGIFSFNVPFYGTPA